MSRNAFSKRLGTAGSTGHGAGRAGRAWLAIVLVIGVAAGTAGAGHRSAQDEARGAGDRCRTPSASGPGGRPNIVVIMTDDQDARSMWVMPHASAFLASRGTSFANSFVSTPLCCPSRATLLTGQYAHHHGVLSNTPPLGGYLRLKHESTLPVWLRRAGYRTGHVGKYLNGYGYGVPPTTIPPGWTEWYATIGGPYYNYVVNANGELRAYGAAPEEYDTDVLARYAVRFVERAALHDAPFFLWLAFTAPHIGREHTAVPAPRHRGRFATAPLPAPPSFNEADVSDKPLWIRLLPRFGATITKYITDLYRGRLEALLAVDEAVRDIVAALERAGVLDRTVIIYTSDNGFFLGEHRIPIGKGLLYEESLRVPLIIRGPGVPEGCTLDHLAVNIDLAPTIAEWTGAAPERRLDGCSLVPLLTDPGTPWREDFLVEAWDASGAAFGVRTSRYAYLEASQGRVAQAELYDLATDPFQLDNLLKVAPRDSYADTLAHLKARLRELRSRTEPDCGAAPSGLGASGSARAAG
jgi:arylsulfatase A-like enzyme